MLQIRLRLAYYKVMTNQTTLPLKRLPSPQSSPSDSPYNHAIFTPLLSKPNYSNPPLSSASTVTLKSSPWQTPVKQQLQLASSSNIYANTKRNSAYIYSIKTTPTSMGAAKSLLHLQQSI